jgi:Domain of unknown function (DUF4328)
MVSRPVTRSSLGPLAGVTITLLGLTAVLSGVDLFLDLAHEWPGSLIGVWLTATLVTGVVFLTWFSDARRNTASYGPGRVTRYPNWTLAGWICPVAWFWVPYRVTTEILAASARPTTGAPARLAAGPAMVALLRVWWTLWLGTWVAGWSFVVVYAANADLGVTRSQQVVDLVFDLLGAGAAGCAIAVVTIITRWQARRNAEPAFLPEAIPRAGPSGVLALSGILLLPPLLLLEFGLATTGWLLPPAQLMPTRAEIVGTWRADDGGTLVFYPDGQFSATGLSADLSAGGTQLTTRWSGTGQWQMSSACADSAPGICLTVSLAGPSEDAWTVGAPSSPAMILPVTQPGLNQDDYLQYEFWKRRRSRAPAPLPRGVWPDAPVSA